MQPLTYSNNIKNTHLHVNHEPPWTVCLSLGIKVKRDNTVAVNTQHIMFFYFIEVFGLKNVTGDKNADTVLG